MQHLNERIAEEELVFPVVKTPCHLLQVGGEMLHRNLMPRAHHATLEQRERGFNRVRRDAQAAFVADVFFGLMIDRFMFAVELRGVEIVEPGFVRHNHVNSFVHVPSNNLVNLVLVEVRRRDEMQATAALPNAHDWRVFLPLVRILCVTADIHLINFHGALEFVLCLFHCFADAVTEIPRRLIRQAEHSLDLVCRNPLARFGNQISDEKPFREREMRVMEDRSYGHGELIAA